MIVLEATLAFIIVWPLVIFLFEKYEQAKKVLFLSVAKQVRHYFQGRQIHSVHNAIICSIAIPIASSILWRL